MHLGGSIFHGFTGFTSSMQNSPAANLPSLSSTHPINGDIHPQASHNEAVGINGPPPRSARRTGSLASKTQSQRAAQAAKHEIRSKLREDWMWSPDSQASCLDQQKNLPDSDSAWQERGSDSSYSTIETAPNPYQYESPDAVAQPAVAGRRRRQQRLEEEMVWNDGLRHYVEQRNAWSGARVHSLPSSLSNVTSNFDNAASPLPEDPSPPDSHQPLTSESMDLEKSTQTHPVTMIPLAPPLLPPDNIIRAAITPATYPSIYSKVVIQGLSPTVPINLSDVVSSLVQGWKADGEWPPRREAQKAAELDGTLDEDIGGVRDEGKRLAKKGIGRLKRALGVGNGQESSPSGVDLKEQVND